MSDSKGDIAEAEMFARNRHKNQKKKDGITPYFEHLEGVVYRLKSIGVTESDVICAAWLHDVLEKTDTTLDEIIQRFGRRTATLVLSLTKNQDLPKKEAEELAAQINFSVS